MLADLQRRFWEALRSPDGPPADTAERFLGARRLSGADGLWIYRRMYWQRQVAALREIFPLLVARLGEQRFDSLARRYLEAHPSSEPRIEMVGRHLAGFLAAESGAESRALADLALVEWAEMAVLLAADPPTVLRTVDVDPAIFPACRLLFVPALAVVHLSGDPFGGGASDPVAYVVWRRGYHARRAPLGAVEATALVAALGGASVASVCEAFASVAEPETAVYAALRQWLRDAWVAAIVVPGRMAPP